MPLATTIAGQLLKISPLRGWAFPVGNFAIIIPAFQAFALQPLRGDRLVEMKNLNAAKPHRGGILKQRWLRKIYRPAGA